jgi:Fe-S-cluster containining protein
MLYVTDLEAAAMARPGEVADSTQSQVGLCPFQRGAGCGVYERRALGCRTYYCDTTYQDERKQLYETALRELRAIQDRYQIAHEYQPVTAVNFEDLRNGRA